MTFYITKKKTFFKILKEFFHVLIARSKINSAQNYPSRNPNVCTVSYFCIFITQTARTTEKKEDGKSAKIIAATATTITKIYSFIKKALRKKKVDIGWNSVKRKIFMRLDRRPFSVERRAKDLWNKIYICFNFKKIEKKKN
jgi:hypothetical protein